MDPKPGKPFEPYAGPFVKDGGLVRCVTDGETVVAEGWNGSAWVRDGSTIWDVFTGSPPSPATLEAFGLPGDTPILAGSADTDSAPAPRS